MSFQILGTGSFLPEKVITNEELSRMVDTSDEWITKRVGVKERHVCTTESNTDMAAAAAMSVLLSVVHTCRSLTPTRFVIHSSEVSTIRDSSSLVITFSGRKLPVPSI